uniref:Uncharacterized protein n=1 Tax=Coccidioides posadasii RMSCC 3488 TaxID=454284 RepID=A0A0J6F1N2_COCPO|nr:hypothetical protein CPAG_03115 [Coccidioides posadasii RMSCC 3488]
MTTGGANGEWTQRDVVNGKERTATRWAKLLMESAMREWAVFGGGNVIKPPLVRIPGQNIQVPEAWGGDWPRVADLVILLQRVTDKPSLKAGGGSILPGT